MAIEVKAIPFTYVAHVLGVAGAVMVLVWCIHFRGGLAWEASNKNRIFNIHPVLILIGLIIIGGEAIMSYKSLPLRKEVKKLIHLVLHAIALILGIIGIYCAFKYHNESNIANLYSLHSWVGIGVIVLYGIQAPDFWKVRRSASQNGVPEGRAQIPNIHHAPLVGLTVLLFVSLPSRTRSTRPHYVGDAR